MVERVWFSYRKAFDFSVLLSVGAQIVEFMSLCYQ